MKPRLGIVIPAYNEERRLPQTLDHLREASLRSDFPWNLTHVVVVNDGSQDQTTAVVRERTIQWSPGVLRVLEFRQNLGKGAAVFTGLYELSSADVAGILVADADEATPWKELWPLATVFEREREAFLIFGSRRHSESKILTRQVWWRERMGRIFNQLLRGLTGVPFKDTQCGFKLFRRGDGLARVLGGWTVARFAWDAEVVLNSLAFQLRCVEHPIEWRHVDESRVHPVRDSLQMAKEILRIRLKRSIKGLSMLRLENGRPEQTGFSTRVKTQVISN